MTQLTTEDIRTVVRDEQTHRFDHIEKTLDRVADSMEKMSDFMIDAEANNRANDQKFIRVHERIEGHEHRINDVNQSILTITTDVIPGIEQEVAKNTLSSGVFWKFIFMLVVPLCSGVGTILYVFQSSQKAQISAIVEAIKLMAGG